MRVGLRFGYDDAYDTWRHLACLQAVILYFGGHIGQVEDLGRVTKRGGGGKGREVSSPPRPRSFDFHPSNMETKIHNCRMQAG